MDKQRAVSGHSIFPIVWCCVKPTQVNSTLKTPTTAASSLADSLALRAALSRFATGVTIVTSRDAARQAVGLTCNSFTSLSLTPPMVTWALNASSPRLAAFTAARGFAVNVLSAQQLPLAQAFARRSASHKASAQQDRFDQVPLLDEQADLPLLSGALAWFECRTVATHTYGDHVLFVGEVERFHDSGHAQDPLLFMNGILG
jgi:flavin reductase (DIM6/NTAB) family NADH-FMN oxidoreductase RutF